MSNIITFPALFAENYRGIEFKVLHRNGSYYASVANPDKRGFDLVSPFCRLFHEALLEGRAMIDMLVIGKAA